VASYPVAWRFFEQIAGPLAHSEWSLVETIFPDFPRRSISAFSSCHSPPFYRDVRDNDKALTSSLRQPEQGLQMRARPVLYGGRHHLFKTVLRRSQVEHLLGNSFLSLVFSSSSAFSRFASDTVTPLNLAFDCRKYFLTYHACGTGQRTLHPMSMLQ